jgi:hypothetical protein
MNKDTELFWKKYYSGLEGATITKFAGMNDAGFGEPNGFPSFQVKFADGSEGIIEISRDPEGNGGGFIFGLPAPQN